MKLITDRKKENVTRVTELSLKTWNTMTASEKAEWSGNPLTSTVVANLIPPHGDSVKVRDGSIIAEEYGAIVIGNASDFSGKTVTLSAEFMSARGELSLGWSDGMDAGCVLSAAGSVTETITESDGTQLILYVSAGYYGKAMLELGRTRHAYVPYTEVVATEATKGAYNISDLNRVERAVAEIAEMLGVSVETKTDWNIWDVPEKTDWDRYIGNIRLLQEVCGETTMLPEKIDKLTYSTANEIEAVLLRCRKIAEGSVRCGEVFCGEVS